MTRISRPALKIAGAVTLTCFSVGFVGAFGAHAIDTQMAVSDARAAADEVEAKRTALEESLSEAHGAVRDAKDVVDETHVAAAAQALSFATQSATDEAARSGVVVDIEPVKAADVRALAEAAVDDELTTPDEDSTQEAANEVTPGSTTEPPTPGLSPTAAPQQAEADGIETAPVATVVDLIEDVEVARVLAGETESADEANAAARRLEEASRALDVALAAVDGGAEELSNAAVEAAHGDTLLLLDAAVSDAEVVSTSAAHTLDATADRVVDDALRDEAEHALTALESSAATARLVDRGEPHRVVEEFDGLVIARASFDAAMRALESTHEAWIDDENAAIDARNEALRQKHEEQVAAARDEHAQANRDAVSARANGWTGRPEGVAGTNGTLSFESLCEVSFAPGHRLQCDAAASLEEADAAYFAETGTHLTMTDSYRSYSLQVRTRAIKPTTAAVPGTSNHGWGMAIDLDRPSATWLAANGADYGWVNPTWAQPGGIKPEWWHLEYVATNVGAFEAPKAPDLEERVTSAFATSGVAEN